MAITGQHLLRLFLCVLAVLCLACPAVGQAIAIPERPAGEERENGPRLLEDDQVNLIKIYEVDLATQPRISIDDDVLEAFLKEFASDNLVPKGRDKQREFMRAEGYQQLELFFAVRARDYYGKAVMRGEPENMTEWHRSVHRSYILEYFRPSFGIGQVEQLYLFDRGREQDRISYTNFYILTQVRIGGVPMIDRDRPEESLILQWGLPRESAKFPAPEDVPNWQPYFRDTEDQRYTRIVEWIKTLVADNRNTDYGITYRLPRHRQPEAEE